MEAAGAAVPDGVELIDEPNGTLLPGLVDAHVHLCADAAPDALGRLTDRPESDLSTGHRSVATYAPGGRRHDGPGPGRPTADAVHAVAGSAGARTTFRRWWGRRTAHQRRRALLARWAVRRAASTGSARLYVCGRRPAPTW